MSTLNRQKVRNYALNNRKNGVPEVVTSADEGAETAEAGVEAVVDPGAILLKRVGVHLGQHARAAAPGAETAVDSRADIRAAGLDPR